MSLPPRGRRPRPGVGAPDRSLIQATEIPEKTKKKTAAPFSYQPIAAKREIKRPDSLRGQVEELLKKGAKIAEVETLVAASDKRRKGKKPTASVERRARRVVKKMHTSHGYGVAESKSGVIKIFTKK